MFLHDHIDKLIDTLLFFIMLSVIFIFLAFKPGEILEIRNKEVEKPIYSLTASTEGNGNLSGTFVIGIGMDSGVNYYVYESSEDGKILKSFNAEKTYINEVNDTPHAKYVYKVTHYKSGRKSESLEKIILNVPYGTIKKEYNAEIR